MKYRVDMNKITRANTHKKRNVDIDSVIMRTIKSSVVNRKERKNDGKLDKERKKKESRAVPVIGCGVL
jgi:hypothetical protein